MKFKGRVSKLGLSLSATMLTLVSLEMGLRTYHAAERYFTSANTDQVEPVPLHIVTDSPFLYGLNPEHSDISSQGTRDDEVTIPKPTNTLRILVLGDSVAYGSVVPRANTFPNRLEGQLRKEPGSVDVINSAVMGYTPYNELQYYLTRGKSFEADIVIVAFCMNDVVNPRLHWGDVPGVKIPKEAIPNHDYDQNHIFPKIQRLRAEQQARSANPERGGPPLLRHSELYSLLESGIERIRRKKTKNPADNSSGLPTYVTGEDTLSIEVLLDRTSPEWRWLASIYDRLHDAVRADRAKLVIVIFPLAYQLDPHYPFLPQERIVEYCRQNSIPCLDLLPSFRQHRKEDIFLLDKEGFYDIWHLTEYGHRLTAEEVLRFLREEELLSERESRVLQKLSNPTPAAEARR